MKQLIDLMLNNQIGQPKELKKEAPEEIPAKPPCLNPPKPGMTTKQLKKMLGNNPLEPMQADETIPPEWSQSSET